MKFLRRNAVAIFILIIATAFIAIGIKRGEAQTVYRKASNICMECIGIG